MIYTKGGFYHIYNRGCNKELIFFSEHDYHYLLDKIEINKKREKFNIIAYCLMPNHYHFLIQQKSELPVSSWISFIFNGYVQSINKQQNRSGTLFEGRAKSKQIDKEKYLIRLVLYIHFNPVSAGLVSKPEEWEYSNYLEWIGKRNGKLVDKGFIFDHFGNFKEYEELMKIYSQEKQDLDDISNYLFDDEC